MENHWRYEILYDRNSECYIMAEVYYDKNKPVGWCRADIQGDTLEELGVELDLFYRTYINQSKIKRIDKEGRFRL